MRLPAILVFGLFCLARADDNVDIDFDSDLMENPILNYADYLNPFVDYIIETFGSDSDAKEQFNGDTKSLAYNVIVGWLNNKFDQAANLQIPKIANGSL